MSEFNKPSNSSANTEEVCDELYRVAWNSALRNGGAQN
jgi:hypothetical protein